MHTDHNLTMLLKDQGRSTQQAIDELGEMIHNCCKRWYTALANMPTWREEVDREALKFLEGCRNAALGNLHWR
jgi:hypothetical protein